MIQAYGVILISNLDKKILVVEHFEGHWGFPKGGLEVGETGRECALRELEEEVGIKPNYLITGKFISETYKISEGIKKVSYFIGFSNRKNVTLNTKELKNYSWESIQSIKNNKNFLSKNIILELEKYVDREPVLRYKKEFSNKIKNKSGYTIQGSKHAYSRVCALSLISKNIFFENIPNILDVGVLDEIKHCSDTSSEEINIPIELSALSRSLVPLLPGLIFRHKKVRLNFPQGCSIGERKIDLYLKIIELFGNNVEYNENKVLITQVKHRSINYNFPFPSFSGTSIALIHAAFVQGTTILSNISIEPEILYLIDVLQQCGVKIIFLKERKVRIEGIDFSSIKKPKIFKIPLDRNVLVTKIILAICLNKEHTFKSTSFFCLEPLLKELKKIGVNFETGDGYIKIKKTNLFSPTNLEATFFPGFCSDRQPLIALLLIQINGVSTIHDLVFEDRYNYIKEVKKIIRSFKFKKIDGKLVIHGNQNDFDFKDESKDSELVNLDLRSGALNVMACLFSHFEDIVINDIFQINRGYEDLIGDVIDILGKNHFCYEYRK